MVLFRKLVANWFLILVIQGCQSNFEPQQTVPVVVETPFPSATITAIPPKQTVLPTVNLPTISPAPTNSPIAPIPPTLESTTTPTPIPWVIGIANNVHLLFEARDQNNKQFIYFAETNGNSQVLGLGDLPAGQPWSPDRSKVIVFAGQKAEQIVIIDLQTGDLTPLVLELKPSFVFWSPDGRYLLFPMPTATQDLTVSLALYDIQKGETNPITEPSYILSIAGWSPLGNEIAFVSDREGQFDLYTLDITNLTLRRLTNDAAIELDVQWSPDGNELLFGTPFTPNLPEVGPIPLKELYLIDSTTTQVSLLGDFYYENPVWSPNGSQIAFGRGWICIINVEDKLENCPQPDPSLSVAHTMFPAWSVDGNYVAFRATSTEELCYRVFILDVQSNIIIEAKTDHELCGISRLYWYQNP